MSNFDIDAYLVNRTAADNKLVQLQEASARKIADLEAKRAHNAKIEADNKSSLVNKLGLNPDGFAGGLVNLGAATAAGFSDSLDPLVNTDYDGNKASSIQRRVGDVGISALKSAIAVPEMAVGLADLVSGGEAGKRLEEAGFRPEEAKQFLDSLRTQEQQAASKSVGEAEGFTATLRQIADNPSVVPHALVESLFPMLAVGLAGRGLQALGLGSKVAAGAGEGLVMAGSAAEQIRQQTEDGRLSLKQALAAGTTGVMGAAVSRFTGGVANRLGVGDIDEAIVKGSLGTSQRGVLTRTVGAGALEGTEEMAQSSGEQVLQNVALDKQWDEGVGNAAAMGLVTGTAMGTPMALAETVGEPTKAPSDKPANTSSETAGSPVKTLGELFGKTQAPDTTPEQKQANLAEGEKVIAGLAQAKADAETELASSTLEGTQAKLEARKARLAEVLATSPDNEPLVSALTSSISTLEETVAAFADPKFAKEKEAAARTAQANLTKVTRDLEESSKVMENLRLLAQSPEQVAALIQEADAPVDTASGTPVAANPAIDKIITMAMNSSESLGATEALALADNASNGLSEDQRAYLRSFSTARIAENEARKLPDVNNEVLHGSKPGQGNNKGISQYRRDISTALASGNTAQAKKWLGGLQAFAVTHNNKAAVVEQAWDNELGKGTQVAKIKGTWQISPFRETKEERKKSGSLELNSGTLVTAIKAEAAALNAAVAEMENAFVIAGKKGTRNVTDQPSESSGTQAQSATDPVSPTPPVASDASVQGADARVGNGDGSGTVQPASVGEPVASISKTEVNAAENTPYVVTATQEEYDEAVRFNESTSEYDYDNIPSSIGLIASALVNGEEVKIVPAVTKPTEARTVPVETEKSSVESSSTEEVVESSSANKESKDSTTDSVESEQSSESAEQTLEKQSTEEDSTTSKGVLSFFDEAVDLEAPYYKQHLLATYWKQATDGRALASVKDWLTSVTSDGLIDLDKVAAYLPENELQTGDPEQKIAALDMFARMAKDVFANLKANFPTERKDPDYRYQDFMEYLYTGNGKDTDVDENVKTAIAFAVSTWVTDAVSAPALHKDEAIVKLLAGANKRAYVPGWVKTQMRRVGSRDYLLVDSLGGAVLESLGLRPNKKASKEQEVKLRTALGNHALMAMEQMGLVTRTEVSAEQFHKLQQAVTPKKDRTVFGSEILDNPALTEGQKTKALQSKRMEVHTFFALARQENSLAPVNKAQQISKANKGTQGLLAKLFKVEAQVKMPSLEPIARTQKTTKGTNMLVAKELNQILAQNQANQRIVRKDTYGVLAEFTEEEVLEMAGAVHVDKGNLHIDRIPGIEAKNDGLAREYALFNEYVGEYLVTSPDKLDTPFYLEYSVWRQQRVGIATSGVNPQTSKIVRQLISSPKWKSTISSTDEKAMESFWLRVAEGVGTKTERAANEKSVQSIQALLKEPLYAAAVSALEAKVAGNAMDQAGKDAVRAAVVKSGENLHSLNALLAVAQHNVAKATGGAEFTFDVELAGEVDGVANGTMLSILLLGAAGSQKEMTEFLNRGGFFEVGSEYQHFNEYRGTAGNMDVYESTAKDLYEFLQAQTMSSDQEYALAHIWNLSGSLLKDDGSVSSDGRNLVKNALNPLAFGSGMAAIKDGMANAFIESVLKRFEKLANQAEPATQEEIDSVVNSVNGLIWYGDANAPLMALGMPLSKYLNTSLTDRTVDALKKAFTDTVGTASAEVVESKFSYFLQARDNVNATINAVHALSSAVTEGMREEFIKELEAKGEVPVNPAGNRVGDLNAEQEKELTKRTEVVLATVDTIYSQVGGNNKAGVLAAKAKRVKSKDPIYAGTTRFGRKQKNGKAGRTIAGVVTELVEPGVGLGSALIHSFDSYVSHAVQKIMDVLNIHDAVAAGVSGEVNLQDAAKAINKALFDGAMEYSPATAAANALSDVVAGIAYLVEKNELSPNTLAKVKEALANLKTDYSSDLQTLLKVSREVAAKSDRNKFGFLGNLAFLDQYAFNGGNYAVTDADRAAALAKAEKVSDELTKNDKRATAVLNNALEGKDVPAFGSRVGGETAADTQESTFDFDDQEADEVPDDKPAFRKGKTVFGELGTSSKNNPEIAAFFEAKPERTAKEVLKFMHAFLAKHPEAPNREFLSKLVRKVAQSVPDDLPVTLITKDTKESDVLSIPQNAYGWYAHPESGKTGAVYILGPDYALSNMKFEVLLHELLHAATAGKLRSPAAAKQKAQLEQLLEDARKYVKANGISNHDNKLQDLDELIAYGMSNAKFQQEVLAKVETTAVGAPMKAMKAFATILAKLLGFSSQQDANGLGVLFSNVAALLDTEASTDTNNGVVTMAMQANTKVATYSTVDIHQALDDGKLGTGFQNHLANLLSNVAEKLHGPFGSFKAGIMKDQALTPMDVWTKALDTGVAPFASKILASGFQVSQQEAFAIEQVEATVRAALDGNGAQTSFAYSQLSKLYMEARKKLSPKSFYKGDWSQATQAEKDQAEDLHAFVFALNKGNGDKMDYLSRFAALGLAHEGFNKVLTAMQTEVGGSAFNQAKGFLAKLQSVFMSILEMFGNRITGTYAGQPADRKLTSLVSKLVDIEAKKRNQIALNEARKNKNAGQTTLVDGISESIRDTITGVLDSSLIKKSGSKFVQGAGRLARTVAEYRVDQLMEIISVLRDKQVAGRPGILAGTFNNVRGPKEAMEAMVRMAKGYEGRRKDLITAVSKATLQAFANKGADLTRDSKASITRVFLRTGMHTLLDTMGLEDMEKLVGTPAVLSQEIAAAEQALNAFGPYQHYFKAQADALGYAKSVRVASAFTMMNASNIARMHGTANEFKLSAVQEAAATVAIEKLVTLYALEHAPMADRMAAREILRTENSRTDGGNGVEFVLRLQKRQEQEAKERLFKGQEALMIHGYTAEIHNPYVEVVTAYVFEEKALLDQGYVKVGPLQYDPADPDTENKAMYVLKDGGLQSYLSGAMSLRGMASKGSSKHPGYMNVNTFGGAMNSSMQSAITAGKQKAINDLFKPAPRKDFSKDRGSKLVPVLNPSGEVVNWRYMMSEQNRDTLLERDNSFDAILGTVAGATYDKGTTQEQNTIVLNTLKEVYLTDYSKAPASFILVGAKSDDPEMREIWNMLPDETKAAAKKVFGPSGIRVRKDSLDMVFGYRKYSLANIMMKDKDARNTVEEIFAKTVEVLMMGYAMAQGKSYKEAREYTQRAAMTVRKSERVWQAIVQETKDIVVVRTGIVLVGNVWSNLSLLWLKGVPLKDMAHHHYTAIKGATKYMAEKDELGRLTLLRDSGFAGTEEGGMKGIENRIAMLEDSMARNPVKELIDAGLLPSIVEDVAAEEDPYSYKSLAARKLSSATEWVPSLVKQGVEQVYMGRQTATYKALFRSTQLSDFAARYVLYQHLIARDKKPLSKQAALFEASESFINYDLPMHRSVQFADDMGLTPFMKYFLNIQRVLQKTAKEHPGRMLSMLALGQVMDLGPVVLGSSALAKVGLKNPMEAGAVKFFGTVDDLATINAMLALIK